MSPVFQPLLPRHGDSNSVLRFDQMIESLRGFGNSQLYSLNVAVELVAARTIVGGNGRPAVHAYITSIIGGENHRLRHGNLSLPHLLAVEVKSHIPALAQPTPGVGELHAYLMLARW